MYLMEHFNQVKVVLILNKLKTFYLCVEFENAKFRLRGWRVAGCRIVIVNNLSVLRWLEIVDIVIENEIHCIIWRGCRI